MPEMTLTIWEPLARLKDLQLKEMVFIWRTRAQPIEQSLVWLSARGNSKERSLNLSFEILFAS